MFGGRLPGPGEGGRVGLRISHDGWTGPYTAFNRFRYAVIHAMGGYHGDHYEWFYESESRWGPNKTPGIFKFLNNPDDRGEIDPWYCAGLVDDLTALLPALEAEGTGVGAIEHRGGYRAVAEKLIAAARRAAEANEPLEFG